MTPGIWNGLGFDYYGAHYYGWMDRPANNGNPMTIDYYTTHAQQLDAPVVIGEFPANGGTAPVYPAECAAQRAKPALCPALHLYRLCAGRRPRPALAPTRPRSSTILPPAPRRNADGLLPPYGGWTGTCRPGAGTFTGAARIISNGPVAAVITRPAS